MDEEPEIIYVKRDVSLGEVLRFMATGFGVGDSIYKNVFG
jgi:hypothetical protein